MRFLLLGDHPDGVAAALRLAAAGHVLAAFAGPANTATRLVQEGQAVPTFRDAEEALARADVEAVVMADSLPHRPTMLKRALQSDFHVVAVHPVDLAPDIAYEAIMIQRDSRKRLTALLVERLHPAWQALRRHVTAGAVGEVQSVELERRFLALPATANELSQWETHPLLTLWDGLRLVAGEVREVAALAAGHGEELTAADALTITGSLASGALLQILLTPLPAGPETLKVQVRGATGTAELTAPAGLTGPTTVKVTGANGPPHEESFAGWDRGLALADVAGALMSGAALPVTWTDATRCLELFDATRRSAKRRRVHVMEYEAATELGNFKSTMTAMGCGVLLLILVLFFATPAVPWLKYLIPVLLAVFLGLQVLRWFAKDELPPPPDDPGKSGR